MNMVCATCNRVLVNIEHSDSSYESFVCVHPECPNKRVQAHHKRVSVR